MATAYIFPSEVTLQTGISSTNESNIWDDNASTYATFQTTSSGTSNRYFFIKGFDFDMIPDGATINSFTVTLRGYATGHATSSSYAPALCNGTTVLTGCTASSNFTGVASNYTIPTGSYSFSTLKSYGSDFGVRINARRSQRNTASYVYIHSVLLTVDYTAGAVSVTGVTLDRNSASIEAGSTLQLTATVSPSNATNKTVSWSSSNTSVATVSNGLVTAVSAGSATITVTTADGGYTATCAVTVTPAVTYEYVLANSMEVGKTYLIANGNSGSVYLLTNESGGSRLLKGASATVSGNKISVTGSVKAKAEFECVRYTSGNDNTITVKSDNKYLYCDNSTGLRMNAPATLDRFWHYREGKFWQFKSTSSDGYSDTSSEYKYYLTLSGTNFTDSHVDTAGIENSSIPLMYVYEPYVPSDDALYVKLSGSWTEVTKAYKKVNGSWVEQSDLTTVFQSGTNYVKGN